MFRLLIGPVFLCGVALPFYILYLRSADNWWAAWRSPSLCYG